MPLRKLLSKRAAFSNPPSSAIFNKYGVNILLIDTDAVRAYLEGILGTQ